MNIKRELLNKRFIFLSVVLLFCFVSGQAVAIIGVPRSKLLVTIIDAVRYRDPQQLQIDIQILENPEESTDHIFIPGRRISVNLPFGFADRLKISQKIRADFEGAIDDLGSGRITVNMIPESIEIVETSPEAKPIRFSALEYLFDIFPVLKLIFILAGWTLAYELCFRPPPRHLSRRANLKTAPFPEKSKHVQ